MKQLILGLALLLAAAPAAAQQRISVPHDRPYVHAASGMTFPAQVGGYQRGATITRFAADGSDESVSYRLATPNGFVQATVYVYPSPPLAEAGGDLAAARTAQCAAQFESVADEISRTHPNTEVLQGGETQLHQGDAARSGHALIMTVSSPSGFGASHPPLRSEAYLFCYVGGRWSVKYRFTYAGELAQAADVAGFMHDLVWTIPDGAN